MIRWSHTNTTTENRASCASRTQTANDSVGENYVLSWCWMEAIQYMNFQVGPQSTDSQSTEVSESVTRSPYIVSKICMLEMNSHSIFCTHRVRLWYVYQHLVAFYGKWKKICHTWIPWGAEYGRILWVFMRDQTPNRLIHHSTNRLITSQVGVVWASQRVLESFINTFQHVQPEHFLWWEKNEMFLPQEDRVLFTCIWI